MNEVGVILLRSPRELSTTDYVSIKLIVGTGQLNTCHRPGIVILYFDSAADSAVSIIHSEVKCDSYFK